MYAEPCQRCIYIYCNGYIDRQLRQTHCNDVNDCHAHITESTNWPTLFNLGSNHHFIHVGICFTLIVSAELVLQAGLDPF